ncbi:MAG: beta-ketoacyl synthase N-terminal-like domain-containing protein [Planctomycetota bacterium]|jgi:3-oxoacyl-[acyl-carrier-protein] synthase II
MRRVAITGFGVVSPIGVGRSDFWQSLRDGKSGIGRITRFDAGTFAVQLAGEVKEPPDLHHLAARTAAADPKVGFAFAAASETLEQAGISRLDAGTWLHLGTSLEAFPLDRAVVDGRPDFAALAVECLGGGSGPIKVPLDTAAMLIAMAHGRPGRSFTNCSACAAGAQAIGHGFRSIRSGRCRVAVCGGFDSMINPLGVGGFQLLGALTTDTELGAAACRPFDASRSGTVLGEGAAVLVLEDYERARTDGKRILAEVCGYGSTLDAHGLSAPDPEGDGAARAMRGALDDAAVGPDAISYVNAHGTGTRLNDEVEAAASVFDGVRACLASALDVPADSVRPEDRIVDDLSGGCLRVAREGAEREGLAHRVSFVRANLERCALESGCADLVVSTCSLHHWRRPGVVLRELRRLTTQAGQVWILDHSPAATAADRRKWVARVRRAAGTGALFRAIYTFESRFLAYSEGELRKLCRDAGLDVTSYEIRGMFLLAKMRWASSGHSRGCTGGNGHE